MALLFIFSISNHFSYNTNKFPLGCSLISNKENSSSSPFWFNEYSDLKNLDIWGFISIYFEYIENNYNQNLKINISNIIIDINGIANQEPSLPKLDTIFSKDSLIFKSILSIIYFI